jgi:hypothetical protein
LFYGLQLFGIAFFLLVAVPYALIRFQKSALSAKLSDFTRQSEQWQSEIKTLTDIQAALKGLRQELSDGPRELRQHLLEMQSRMQMSNAPRSLNPRQSNDYAPQDSLSVNQRVSRKILDQFDHYRSIVDNQIVQKIKSMSGPIRMVIDTNAMQTGLDTLIQNFTRHYRANPDFWHTYAQKGDFYHDLDGEIETFWRTYGSSVDSQSVLITASIAILDSQTNAAGKELAGIDDIEAKLTKRLDLLDSPFGKLPVGLNEALSLFPLLLAAAFVMLSGMMVELVTLRGLLFSYYRGGQQPSSSVADTILAMEFPLHPDFTLKGKKAFGARALLALPCIEFLLSCGLILYIWAGSTIQGATESLSMKMYLPVYCACLGMFIFSYFKIARGVNENRP